jgi:DNA-binding transcriptional ArsR family regulator
MDVGDDGDGAVSRIAAAIGEPARARMLYRLMDGHARTSTELAVVAEVSPSTASVHLNRLRAEGLITRLVQGKHHYYSLQGPRVARALEALSILAGGSRPFVSRTPSGLRSARTCYDHMAGKLGVALSRPRGHARRSEGPRCGGDRRRGPPGRAPPLRARLPRLERKAASSGRCAGGGPPECGAPQKMGGPGPRQPGPRDHGARPSRDGESVRPSGVNEGGDKA